MLLATLILYRTAHQDNHLYNEGSDCKKNTAVQAFCAIHTGFAKILENIANSLVYFHS